MLARRYGRMPSEILGEQPDTPAALTVDFLAVNAGLAAEARAAAEMRSKRR